MARLPVPGSDDNNWGTILNDFLVVEHNTDGTLKKAGDISTALTNANNAQTTANGKIDKSLATTKGDVLAASGASTFARLGVGATQFTINVNTDPGATTATFAWSARM